MPEALVDGTSPAEALARHEASVRQKDEEGGGKKKEEVYMGRLEPRAPIS
jgi:hypothetical protein